VVWLRWLVHLFGATTLAVSTILTAFMGGLALGAWVGGRLAPRLARPLRAYGLLELAIGAYALLLPLLLDGVPPLLRMLGATEASSFGALSLARFGLAAALLVVPTACMGATLPILAEAVTARPGELGGRVGRLYAVNTAGAVLGTAAAGLALLPTLGVTATNRIAIGLNVAVGLAALVVADRLRVAALPSAPTGPAPSPVSGPRREVATALTAVLVSGALAMVYEVGWTRALALVLGSSVYAFTVMLTTFLVGLAAGSYLAARRVDRLAEPGLVLALVQVGIAVAAFVGVAGLGELPWLFLRIFAWSGGRHGPLLALEFLLSGALILVPAVLAGAVFPLAVRLAGGAPERAGRIIGRLYAVNTVGAIVGSFAGGFLLLPAAGIRATLVLAIALNLACALAVLWLLPPRRRLLVPLTAAIAAGGLALPALAPAWPALAMSSGVAIYARSLASLSRDELAARRGRTRLLFYEEGLTTTVSVERDGRGLFLRVNGKTDASSTVDMPTQVLLGHLPLFLHPAPREALVIGLGSGVSVGAALRHPLVRVTVVELEPAVVTASRFFDEVNGRPLADPRSRLVVTDARHFLLLTRDQFDVIVSEPSNPWMTGAASLFTREFFELARSRLRPGGVFGQWVQLYSLSPETLRTIVATFGAVFPHTAVFQSASGDTILVGSGSPLRSAFGPLAARMGAPAVAADLRRVGIADPADLMARLVLDEEDVGRFARDAVVNTDDNAHVEFTAPRSLYVDAVAENVQRLTDGFAGGGGLVTALLRGAPDGFAARLGHRLLERDAPQQAERLAAATLAAGPRADLLAVAARAADAQGERVAADRYWQAALARAPADPDIVLDAAARRLADGDGAGARQLLRRLDRRAGGEAALREAALLYRLGDYREGEARLGRVPPEQPGAAVTAGMLRLALGDPAGAERRLRQGLAQGGDDAEAHAALAAALDRLGRSAEAEAERRQAARLDEIAALRLRVRARTRVAAGHLRWAERLLAEAVTRAPRNLELAGERARLLERMGARRDAIAAWETVARAFPGYAPAFLEVATLWEAEGDRDRAREALQRYVAAERDPTLRARGEVLLRSLAPR
jgi:spermidine synthase